MRLEYPHCFPALHRGLDLGNLRRLSRNHYGGKSGNFTGVKSVRRVSLGSGLSTNRSSLRSSARMSRIETSRSSKIDTRQSPEMCEPELSSEGSQRLGLDCIDFEVPGGSDEMQEEVPVTTARVFGAQGSRARISRRQGICLSQHGNGGRSSVLPKDASSQQLTDDFACIAILQQQQSQRSTIGIRSLRLGSRIAPDTAGSFASLASSGPDAEEMSSDVASLSIPPPSEDCEELHEPGEGTNPQSEELDVEAEEAQR